MHTCIQSYVTGSTQSTTPTYIHTYIHAYIHTPVWIIVPDNYLNTTYMYTCIHTYTHVSQVRPSQSHPHAYIHTCIHTYTSVDHRTRQLFEYLKWRSEEKFITGSSWDLSTQMAIACKICVCICMCVCMYVCVYMKR